MEAPTGMLTAVTGLSASFVAGIEYPNQWKKNLGQTAKPGYMPRP